jgi:hypothetical protein
MQVENWELMGEFMVDSDGELWPLVFAAHT